MTFRPNGPSGSRTLTQIQYPGADSGYVGTLRLVGASYDQSEVRKQSLPTYTQLAATFSKLHKDLKKLDKGEVADYIPELKKVPPDNFGAAFCLVNPDRETGKRAFHIGDKDPISIQSVSKVVTMCAAIESNPENGEYFDKYVGHEPSGAAFNELSLQGHPGNPGGLQPKNPMINAGAIMTSALYEQDLSPDERVQKMLGTWGDLMDTRRPQAARASAPPVPEVDTDVRDSEKSTGHNNRSMVYAMLAKGLFPKKTEKDALEALDIYFSFCSIKTDVQKMAVVAATLANDGVNPHTKKRIFKSETVRRCLSVMRSCGTYDGSGNTMYTIELPAKSGVGGMVMVVVPGYMGFAVASPRLDSQGNSVRGMEFCRELVGVHPELRDTSRLLKLRALIGGEYRTDEAVAKPPSVEEDDSGGGHNPHIGYAPLQHPPSDTEQIRSLAAGADPRHGPPYPQTRHFVNIPPALGY